MRRDVFQAIADPVRRDIIDMLSKRAHSVSDVAAHFDISRQAVSKQLKILDECGLVSTKKEGREKFYAIQAKSLIPAFLWIEQFQKQWEQRVDSFELYLNTINTAKEDDGRK